MPTPIRLAIERFPSPVLRAIFLVIGVTASAEALAVSFTPGGICTEAGFPKGDAFREACVDRVYQERRSRAWREQAPYALMGAVAGIAANGGSAMGFVSVPGQTNLRQVNVGAQSFIVHVPTNAQATVVSSTRYKNIPKGEMELWARAAAQATGCAITKYVKDFDALYVWTDCAKSSAQAVAQPAQQALETKENRDLVGDLARLAELRDKGILSADEFRAAKAKLLGQ